MELHTFDVREAGAFPPIPPLDTNEVTESLARLVSHGLVDGEERGTFGTTIWAKLRVTAQGWIVLGEWPDLDRVATAASFHRLLRALAEDAPAAEKHALVRAAGVLSRTADDVVRATVADVAGELGAEAVE
jgi:hypothetical protein